MKCKAIVEVTLPVVGPIPIACTEGEGHLPQPHAGRGEVPIPRTGLTLTIPLRWGGPLDGEPSQAPPQRPHGGS